MLVETAIQHLKNTSKPDRGVYIRDAIGGCWPAESIGIGAVDRYDDRVEVVISAAPMSDEMRFRRTIEILARAWGRASAQQRGQLARATATLALESGTITAEMADDFLNLAQEIRAALA